MFRSQQIIIKEYVCTSLNLLNYLKNTEFKILKIIPGVVAAKLQLQFCCHNTGNNLQDFKFSVFLNNSVNLTRYRHTP